MTPLLRRLAPAPTPAPKPEKSSAVVAADRSLFPLWDAAVPFPHPEEMPELRVVTQVSVERADAKGYHYLHETALAFHQDRLYLGWANHKTHESNIADEIIRGTSSPDEGITWEKPTIWAAPPLEAGESFNHPVLLSHQGRLWGFFTSWHGGPDWRTARSRTDIFTLDEAGGRWEPTGVTIPGFIPFTPPRRLSDGHWIMSGENFWFEAAVVISPCDAFTEWKMIVIPVGPEIELRFPETTLLDYGHRLVAICRQRGSMYSLLASESRDLGRTWSPLRLSNFPASVAKPLAGVLSTGQRYLISNNLEKDRSFLSLAVTRPGEEDFCRVWKIRDQLYPRRRYFRGGVFEGQEIFGDKPQTANWIYPSAEEHRGRLFVSYTQGKEDAALSIIPISALAVDEVSP